MGAPDITDFQEDLGGEEPAGWVAGPALSSTQEFLSCEQVPKRRALNNSYFLPQTFLDLNFISSRNLGSPNLVSFLNFLEVESKKEKRQ